MSFNDFVIATAGKNNYRNLILGMNKSKTMNRIKNVDLKWQNRQFWLWIKNVVVMSNNFSETMNRQLRYQKQREKDIEKYEQHYERNKATLLKLVYSWCKRSSEEEIKNKKQNVLKVGIEICLKKKKKI